MRIHYLQHVPFEGPGSIAHWAAANGYEITNTRLFESAAMPDLSIIDLLVIMGGPMSVNDEYIFPWLEPEKKFIREAIETGKPVLGICLGAQLIASSLGSRIYRNEEKEIGWFPVYGIQKQNTWHFNFPSSIKVFHWHGETYDLPKDSVLLARSEGCKNQAFQFGKSVIGLQFHLETTQESALSIVTNCRDELVRSKYIQSEKEILSAKPDDYKIINKLMGKILSYLSDNYNNEAA